VNLNILHHQEDKEITNRFHMNIQVNKTNIDSLFNYGSHDNIVAMDMVNKIGLEVHDHPSPYPLGWVNKDWRR
jgi:hypothetical protein